jgi:hypothetical protein
MIWVKSAATSPMADDARGHFLRLAGPAGLRGADAKRGCRNGCDSPWSVVRRANQAAAVAPSALRVKPS